MSEAVFDAMGNVLVRWTMGSAAAPAVALWKAELGNEAHEAELRLLALSAHFLGTMVTVGPPAELGTLPDIPVLVLPTVPDALRPLTRRLLASGNKQELLRFIAVRGWTVHPGDWMPFATDQDTPDVYAPWRDWAEMTAWIAKPQRAAVDQLTVDNWSDWAPEARKFALTQVRLRYPAEARALLEAKLVGENADTRLRLLQVMAYELSLADVHFLEGIAANDRAPKLKALATALLSRLSRGPPPKPDHIADIKEFFSVEIKGWLRRSRVVKFAPPKSGALAQWRADLLGIVDAETFAGALGLTGPELIKAWDWAKNVELNGDFLRMVGRSAPDELVEAALESLHPHLDDNLYGLCQLAPRLTSDRRTGLAAMLLRAGRINFERAKHIVGGTPRFADPLGTPTGTALLAALQHPDAKPAVHDAELKALGLITDRSWAPRVLERLYAAGIVQGDPRLDMLRLNEALEDRGETT